MGLFFSCWLFRLEHQIRHRLPTQSIMHRCAFCGFFCEENRKLLCFVCQWVAELILTKDKSVENLRMNPKLTERPQIEIIG